MLSGIKALPHEVIFRIFNFLEDTDIYVLSNLPFFSDLVNSQTYRAVCKAQCRLKLQRGLGPSRTPFPDLVRKSYVKGGYGIIRLWRDGNYLYSLDLISHIWMTTRFQFRLIQTKLSRLIRLRPSIEVLRARNILPTTSVSQLLVSRWLHLQKIQLVHHLKKKIMNKWRTSLDIHSIGAMLSRFLVNRIQPFELSVKKLVYEKDLVYWICPGVKGRIHFFEDLALSSRVLL